MRGWLAALYDFPRLKSRDECVSPASRYAATLRSDVCCITNDVVYQSLVVSAWVASYQALEQVSEREIVLMVLSLKALPLDEALVFLRPHFVTGGCRDEVEGAYAQFQASYNAAIAAVQNKES